MRQRATNGFTTILAIPLLALGAQGCDELDGDGPQGPSGPGIDNTREPICFRGNSSRVEGIYTRDANGRADRLLEACDEAWGCSADLSACATADSNPGAIQICRDDLENGLTQGRIVWRSELAGSNQQWPTIAECPENTPICDPDGSLSCTTSVIDTDSPWAHRSCPGADEINNPTGLDTDCRCGINQVSAAGLPQCQRPNVVMERGEHVFGAGPRVGRSGRLRGGFVEAEARELIIAGDWSDSSGKYGFLWGIDLDTGDRRIISGTFIDASAGFAMTTIGDGLNFNEPYNVQKGPDGAYYVADNLLVTRVRVIRVDPLTGDRTLAWDASDPDNWGWCPHRNPSASMQADPTEGISVRTFAMDDAGNFYFANMPGGRGSGTAILKISADGQTCSDVTRSGASGANEYVGEERGGGYLVTQGTYSALSIVGGTMFAVNLLNSTLIEIDLATGDRKLLSAASSNLQVGSGPLGRDGIPNFYTMQDPVDPNFIWVVGDEGKTLMVKVDKRDGNRYPISPELNHPKFERFVHGPIFVGNMGAGGMFFDPENPDRVYFAHDRFSLVVAEISTKNNRILSL